MLLPSHTVCVIKPRWTLGGLHIHLSPLRSSWWLQGSVTAPRWLEKEWVATKPDYPNQPSAPHKYSLLHCFALLVHSRTHTNPDSSAAFFFKQASEPCTPTIQPLKSKFNEGMDTRRAIVGVLDIISHLNICCILYVAYKMLSTC